MSEILKFVTLSELSLILSNRGSDCGNPRKPRAVSMKVTALANQGINIHVCKGLNDFHMAASYECLRQFWLAKLCSCAALQSPRTYPPCLVIQSVCSYEPHHSFGQPIPRRTHGKYQTVKSEKRVSFHSFQTTVSNLSVIYLNIKLIIKHSIGYLQPGDSYIHINIISSTWGVKKQIQQNSIHSTQHYVFSGIKLIKCKKTGIQRV